MQVFVDGFARDEEVHDLARALEDEIDSVVAHCSLDSNTRLAARREGAFGLVAATTSNLQGLIRELPVPNGVPFLCCGRFQTYVGILVIGELAHDVCDRLHRESR